MSVEVECVFWQLCLICNVHISEISGGLSESAKVKDGDCVFCLLDPHLRHAVRE